MEPTENAQCRLASVCISNATHWASQSPEWDPQPMQIPNWRYMKMLNDALDLCHAAIAKQITGSPRPDINWRIAIQCAILYRNDVWSGGALMACLPSALKNLVHSYIPDRHTPGRSISGCALVRQREIRRLSTPMSLHFFMPGFGGDFDGDQMNMFESRPRIVYEKTITYETINARLARIDTSLAATGYAWRKYWLQCKRAMGATIAEFMRRKRDSRRRRKD